VGAITGAIQRSKRNWLEMSERIDIAMDGLSAVDLGEQLDKLSAVIVRKC
jgi:hypothetical protein